MSEPTPDTPIFDLKRHFDATVTIGDQQLPIRVKRFTRAAWLEFKKQWDAFMETPRGSEDLSAEQREAREREQLAFMERTIAENITLDPGYIRVNGEWVTTGDGLLDAFYSRLDVLSALVAQVFVENTLMPLLRKNSNSPRGSATGSEQSLPTRGGAVQGPTVTSAESASSVESAPAAEGPDSSEASPSSSGATRESEEPIVH